VWAIQKLAKKLDKNEKSGFLRGLGKYLILG
jgi:hypothetical protein